MGPSIHLPKHNLYVHGYLRSRSFFRWHLKGFRRIRWRACWWQIYWCSRSAVDGDWVESQSIALPTRALHLLNGLSSLEGVFYFV